MTFDSLAETFEHDGVTVEIHWDYDAGEHCNPRQWDNISTLVCWHPDYILGDYQLTNGDGRGAVDTPFDMPGDPSSMDVLARYLTLMRGARGLVPLYLYDHSGISISVGRNPYTFDAQGWDTTMVGFAYTTDARIDELCGTTGPAAPSYHTDEWVADAIRSEVKLYDDYLRGNVYGYVVAPGTEDEDSCWGFVGDDEYVKDEARMVAAGVAKDVAARELTRRIYLFDPSTLGVTT